MTLFSFSTFTSILWLQSFRILVFLLVFLFSDDVIIFYNHSSLIEGCHLGHHLYLSRVGLCFSLNRAPALPSCSGTLFKMLVDNSTFHC